MDINLVNTILALLSSVVLLGMAAFVLLNDWRDQVNRFYAFFVLMALGVMLSIFMMYAFPGSIDLTLFDRITQMFAIMFFAIHFNMSMVFPRGKARFPYYYSALITAPAAVVGFFVVKTDMTVRNAFFRDGLLIRELGSFYVYYSAILFLYLLAGILNYARKYRKIDDATIRLQMRYFFLVTSLAIAIAAVTSIILPAFFNYPKLYAVGPAVASFLVTVSLLYNVANYNLMGMRTNIHKTVMYLVISAAIFVPIYAIIAFYYSGFLYMDTLPLPVLTVLIVGIFFAISLFIQPGINRVFRKGQFEFENLVDTFIRDIEVSRNPGSIVEKMVDTLFTGLRIRNAFFLQYNEKRRLYEMVARKGQQDGFEVEPLDRNSTIIRWFTRNREVLNAGMLYSDDKSFEEARDDLAAFCEKYSVAAIIPYYHAKRVMGLLCLGIKDSPVDYSRDEIGKLAAFQKDSNEIISTTVTYQKASEEQFIARTLDLSSYIMSGAVPEKLPNIQGIRFGGFSIPLYEERSDYFDFIRPGEDGIGIVAADVSGVGVNSALYSVVLRSAFRSCVSEAASTSAVARDLNRVLYEYSGGRGELVTGYYLYYDLKTMRLMYTNAGFPPLDLFRIEKNDFDQLDTEGIPLGYDLSSRYGTGFTDLLRGDIGIIYSRSLINSKNSEGENFGILRLREVVKQNRSRRPSEIAYLIQENFKNFMGISSPGTDVLALVFKIG